jgi:hypothetical protein
MALIKTNARGQSSNLGRRNLIINGAMEVAQRSTSSTVNGYGSVDRFQILAGGADEAPTHAQVDVASGTTPYTLGFRKALKITNGNQTSGAGAADYMGIWQHIEGQNISSSGWNTTDPNSKLTFSYWVKSSVAQTFYGRFRAFASSQYEYTYSFALSANTWTKVTTTVPGNSNFSSLVNTNAVGFYHVWQCFWGTDYTNNKTLDAWAVKDNANKSPDMTSTWYTTNDATLEITGVQLETGSTATDFEHRSFGEELSLCQRYFWRQYHSGSNVIYDRVYWNGSGNNAIFNFPAPAGMRINSATVTCTPTTNGTSVSFTYHTHGVISVYRATANGDNYFYSQDLSISAEL